MPAFGDPPRRPPQPRGACPRRRRSALARGSQFRLALQQPHRLSAGATAPARRGGRRARLAAPAIQRATRNWASSPQRNRDVDALLAGSTDVPCTGHRAAPSACTPDGGTQTSRHPVHHSMAAAGTPSRAHPRAACAQGDCSAMHHPRRPAAPTARRSLSSSTAHRCARRSPAASLLPMVGLTTPSGLNRSAAYRLGCALHAQLRKRGSGAADQQWTSETEEATGPVRPDRRAGASREPGRAGVGRLLDTPRPGARTASTGPGHRRRAGQLAGLDGTLLDLAGRIEGPRC